MADPRGRAAKPRGKAAKPRGKVAKLRGKAAKSRGNSAKSRGNSAKSRGKAAKSRGKAAKSRGKAATRQEKITQAVAALVCVLDGGAAADNRDIDSGQHFRDLRTHLARVAEAAGDAEYLGLHDVCLLFQENLPALEERGPDLSDEERDLLSVWPGLVSAYLASPTAPACQDALVAHLRRLPLTSDLTDEDANLLKAMFAEPTGDAAPGSEAGPAAGDAVPGSMLEALAALADDDHPSPLPPADENDGVAAGEEHPAAPGPAPEAASADGVAAGEDLPAAVKELVEILVSELPHLERSLAAAVELGISDAAEADARWAAFERCGDQLARYGAAATEIGFAGLGRVCEHTRDNLLVLRDARRVISADESVALTGWPPRVLAYLETPGHPAAGQPLLEALTHEAWPKPLSAAVAAELHSLLSAPDLSMAAEEVPARPREATAADISLALPEDGNAQLLDGLLQELPGQTEEFSEAIQRLIVGGSSRDVAVAQRIAHTLKGAGNTVGVRGIATLTHHLEDVLIALAKHARLPTRDLAASMMRAADCLEAMGEALSDATDPPDDALEVLQEVLDWANRIDQQGLPTDDAPVTAQGPDAASGARQTSADDLTPALEPQASTAVSKAATTPTLRISAGLVDGLLRLAGETIIMTGQVHERLRNTTVRAHGMQAQFRMLQQLGHELEELIDVKDMSSGQRSQTRQPEFDALEMDEFSELHTCSRRLVEAATDAFEFGVDVIGQLAQLDDMLLSQERANRENQEMVLRTRMLPVESIFPRLKRGVRQTCRLAGKQAELHLSGGDTLMDSDVLGGMVNPLMHVLRNAVDHGIEDAEIRNAAGKPAGGKISLNFFREGSSIVVACQDDGAGFDFDAIRRAAAERGLLPDDKELSEDELKRFILRPNFSTRSQVTQTSGRGIGMDAVYSRVVELGGSVTLQSEAGRGCLVELRLPLTLISSHALLVRAGPELVAIANRGIEQILSPESGDVRDFGHGLIFQIGEDTYPAVKLEFLLNVVDKRATERAGRAVLMVREEAGLAAVLVEAVLDNREVVVKNLGNYIPKLRGILGATILGDGSVTTVLDLPELLRSDHRGEIARGEVNTESQGIVEHAKGLPKALVVDDSLSARRALAQFMEDSGFEVRTARDGMEAVKLVDANWPDILLVDMEMPRMNGLELTTHLRARKATARLPVIMITSRSTAKHREQAEAAGVNLYLTKPFAEDELLSKVQILQAQAQ